MAERCGVVIFVFRVDMTPSSLIFTDGGQYAHNGTYGRLTTASGIARNAGYG